MVREKVGQMGREQMEMNIKQIRGGSAKSTQGATTQTQAETDEG